MKEIFGTLLTSRLVFVMQLMEIYKIYFQFKGVETTAQILNNISYLSMKSLYNSTVNLTGEIPNKTKASHASQKYQANDTKTT